MHTHFFHQHGPTDPVPADDEHTLDANDRHWLRQAFVWANAARIRGNRPFGAIVVASNGRILAEAFSNTIETGDSTGHAEMNAIRQLGTARLAPEIVAGATLYCSAEPCAMCASAICGSGLRRVVYGLDATRLQALRPELRSCHLSCHDILSQAVDDIVCNGPCLLAEAAAVYEDTWFANTDPEPPPAAP